MVFGNLLVRKIAIGSSGARILSTPHRKQAILSGMNRQIMRSKEPMVLECPFELLTEITPNDLFYVRNHFPPPVFPRDAYALTIGGTVEKPITLSYADILALPSRKVHAMLECAGNNRTYLVPQVKGVQWGLGGVSNAEWTGVPLSAVLELAGLNPETVDIVFEGGDFGEAPEEPKPLGEICFSRSLPLQKALEQDVLLAYAMNGEELTLAHGAPLRLIVPGWYAVASVKWLTRITAIAHTFQGYFQTIDYGYWDHSEGVPIRRPITEMLVKALISQPQAHEVIPKNTSYQISGAAWSGTAKIAKVEVSADGGASWGEAKITTEPSTNSWCLWNFAWQSPAEPGEYTLMARATDAGGNTQMAAHDYNRHAYMINFCVPIGVTVR
jgi:DMSO/TMAO reductase YedYZ molybdopterin-dependent catalytic subunit